MIPVPEVECQACGGAGRFRHSRDVFTVCGTCFGRGVHPEPSAAGVWLETGQKHRAERVARGESVAACAKRLWLTARTVVDAEHGRRDPAILYIERDLQARRLPPAELRRTMSMGFDPDAQPAPPGPSQRSRAWAQYLRARYPDPVPSRFCAAVGRSWQWLRGFVPRRWMRGSRSCNP